MSRRSSLARRLKEETKAGRHKKLNVVEWLHRPHASMTREEGYVLVRQLYHDMERRRFLRNPFLFIPYALFLIVWAPIRLTARWILKILEKREEIGK